MRPSASRTCAFSFSEIVIAVLILGAALVPIYDSFIFGSKAVSSSRLAYMASQAARELLEEVRYLPFDKLAELETTTWTPLTGSLFKNILKIKFRDRDPGSVGATAPSYPDEYKRIKYTLKVTSVNPRLKKVTLDLLWEEHGGKKEKHRDELNHYVTLVALHSFDPEEDDPS